MFWTMQIVCIMNCYYPSLVLPQSEYSESLFLAYRADDITWNKFGVIIVIICIILRFVLHNEFRPMNDNIVILLRHPHAELNKSRCLCLLCF